MSKAEEIHYKAVMVADNQEPPKDYVISAHADHFNGFVEGYVEGYHQAEKDMELSWEDIKVIEKLLGFDNIIESPKEFYQEVLKRFKEQRDEDKH